MTPSARCQAAIEILHSYNASEGSLAHYLDSWARNHRYAGSKDRRFIRELIYSVFRRRLEIANYVSDEDPRALVIGALRIGLGLTAEEAASFFDGSAYGPVPLSQSESQLIVSDPCESLEDHVRCNLPLWLFEKVLASGGHDVEDIMMLQERAPLDLRVNALEPYDATIRMLEEGGICAPPCKYAPYGRRVPTSKNENPNRVLDSQAFRRGRVEVQDEGSQLASLLVDARQGHRVLDYCGGGGGKTLAIACRPGAPDEFLCTDVNQRRLQEAKRRTKRAGLKGIEFALLPEEGRPTSVHPLADEHFGFHRVVLDAPCSGSGAWRRRPEEKWAMTPGRLEDLCAVQDRLLKAASGYVCPGGRLVYITCSLFAEENALRVSRFLGEVREFRLMSARSVWRDLGLPELSPRCFLPVRDEGDGLMLAPWLSGTDGFFVAILERVA